MPAFLLTSPENPFSDVVAKHGGVAGSIGDQRGVLFEQAQRAVGCALALQARLAEHNRARADKPLPLRMSVHAGEGPVSAQDLKAASMVLESTPVGRVFLSRQAYAQARDARGAAFIPLGLEYFTGLPEPLEIYEAVRLPGPPRTTTTGNDLLPGFIERSTRPEARAPGPRPVPAAAPPVSSALTLAAVVAATGALFAAKRELMAILSPLDLVNYVFHLGGAVIFCVMPSDSLANMGGPLAQVGMPLAAAAHTWAHDRPTAFRLSLFWFGQSLLSLACPLDMGLSGGSAYGETLRNEMFAVVDSFGLATHAFGVGQSLAAVGCLAMAFAAVSSAWGYLSRGRRE